MTLLRGLWVADHPSVVLRDDYLERLKALELDEHAVMIDGPRPGLSDAYWSLKDLAAFAKATEGWRARRVLSLWAAPQKRAVGELKARLVDFQVALQSRVVEVDGEGMWNTDHLYGYSSLDSAGGALAEVVRTSMSTSEFELTTFPSIFQRLLSIGRHVDRAVMQVYSTTPRNDQDVAYDSSLGPLHFPKDALARARARLDRNKLEHVELAAGLALYHQQWATRSDLDGMSDALAGARESLRPFAPRARWWSSVFVLGGKKIDRRYDWLKATKD
jgi:hypothetical protein